MMSRKITTMTGLRRCPECERQQFPIICNCDSAGYVDVVQCKYCGAKFRQKDNPQIPWNKGKSKYATEEDRKAAARERALKWAKDNPERFAANQERYRKSEKGKATSRAWREANREHLSKKKLEWAKSHPDSRKATLYCYYRNHFAEIKRRAYERGRAS